MNPSAALEKIRSFAQRRPLAVIAALVLAGLLLSLASTGDYESASMRSLAAAGWRGACGDAFSQPGLQTEIWTIWGSVTEVECLNYLANAEAEEAAKYSSGHWKSRLSWIPLLGAAGISWSWIRRRRGKSALRFTGSQSRRCPFCAEKIQKAAITCRWCGRDLPSEG